MLAELALLSSTQPNPAYSSTSSAVQPMLTLDDFEAALERARKHNRLVVIKFYQVARALEPLRLGPRTSAPGSAPDRHPCPSPCPCPNQARCKACLNARAGYEKAAKGPLAERADFYEVDQSVGRLLCTLAKVATPQPVLVARRLEAAAPPTGLTPNHPRLCRSSSYRWRTSTRAGSSWTRGHCTSRPSSGSSSRASRSTRTDTACRKRTPHRAWRGVDIHNFMTRIFIHEIDCYFFTPAPTYSSPGVLFTLAPDCVAAAHSTGEPWCWSSARLRRMAWQAWLPLCSPRRSSTLACRSVMSVACRSMSVAYRVACLSTSRLP